MGLARLIAPTKARTFSTSASSVKLALPTPAWTMPAFSARYSTWPPLAALIASPTFCVTVPRRGLGIRPRGPRILPSLPTTDIMSGVAMQRSNSIWPAVIFSARSSSPTMSAPAALASSALVALGEDGDAQRLAGAVRQHHRAAHVLVGLARIDVEVERDLDGLVELGLGARLDELHRVRRLVEGVAVDALVAVLEPFSLVRHRRYSTTSRPIERAEPTIIWHAPSMSLALRSVIFFCAISRTCSIVTLPTVPLPGVCEPFSIPAAFSRK